MGYHRDLSFASGPSVAAVADGYGSAPWPDYSYVIISVQKGTVASAQSWVLNEAEKKFYEEPLR